MKKQDFNVLMAERVMNWETLIRPYAETPAGYVCYHPDHGETQGFDFTVDHNAAAMVRERVRELGLIGSFLRGLDSLLSYPTLWSTVNATPEQTARAAYLAVTGEELEAIDE